MRTETTKTTVIADGSTSTGETSQEDLATLHSSDKQVIETRGTAKTGELAGDLRARPLIASAHSNPLIADLVGRRHQISSAAAQQLSSHLVKTNVTAITGKRSPSQQPLNGLLSLPDAVSAGSGLPFLAPG